MNRSSQWLSWRWTVCRYLNLPRINQYCPVIQNLHIGLLFSTRINSTTPPHQRFTALELRPLFRKRMLNLYLSQSLRPSKFENGLSKKKACPRPGSIKGKYPFADKSSFASNVLYSFLLNMTTFPEMIRNVAVVGHLHHGKTALMDMLVFETHKLIWDSDKPVRIHFGPNFFLIFVKTRYTDTHILSREREISIKSAPISLVLSTTSGKSHIVHFIDTPGHINFIDEVASAVRLVDGILLVVDAVEGVCFCKIKNLPSHCSL
jgi:hypothetical protein